MNLKMKVICLRFYYTLPYSISPLNICLFKLNIVLISRLVKSLLFAEMLRKAVHGDAFQGFGVQNEAITVVSYGLGAVSGSGHQEFLVQSPLAVLVSDASVSGKLHKSFGSFPAKSRTFLGSNIAVMSVFSVLFG